MLISKKTVAAAALVGALGSPLAAQVMHEGMTCTDFLQSAPETQTEVVESFVAEDATATDMPSEEIVSMILDACASGGSPDDTAHSKFMEAVAG